MENTESLQKPIGSGYNAYTTADEVMKNISMAGKIAIVTGGYSGIGLETVRILSVSGAEVFVPARDLKKAREALKGIPNVTIELMDLTDPQSINTFAEKFIMTGKALHLLVNCAGIMAVPLSRDYRGIEAHLSTNHIGHFQLTMLMWPALLKAHGARVVSVSSWGHRLSPFNFDDPNFLERKYDRWLAYAQSKTANVLFAKALDSYGKPHNIRAYSLHPGGIASSDLNRNLSDEEVKALGLKDDQGKLIIDPSRSLKTIEQGAATILWCCTSKQLNNIGGVYCENCDISPLVTGEDDSMDHSASMPPGVKDYAIDPKNAERLWGWSEQVTGLIIKNKR